MRLAIFNHPDCALHVAGDNHPERPERVLVIQEALKKKFGEDSEVQFELAPLVKKDALMAAHSESYVDFLFSLSPVADIFPLDEDTFMNPHTLKAAQYAAGAVIKAVDSVMTGEVNVAFCNVRPPGHHAERERAMGFCFFNNVAVGALYAMNHYQLSRILIFDFDVHHGNGTQNIFEEDSRVLYCSSFQHPFYPGYEPKLDNDHIISLPLPQGTASDIFREKVKETFWEVIKTFKPQLLFISAGFDAHADDPLANLNLRDDDYVWMTTCLVDIAKACCGGKIISVLEGGYNLATLARCVPLHVEALRK